MTILARGPAAPPLLVERVDVDPVGEIDQR
jgi:hypothetical protein